MKDLKIIYSVNPVFKKCPECGKVGFLHRSRARTMKEQAIKRFTFWNIYRCKECGWRGYLSNLTITKNSLRNLAIYVVLAGVTAFIVKFVLTKFIIR